MRHVILGSLVTLVVAGMLPAQVPAVVAASPSLIAADGPWLFAGFKGNSEDGVFYALSVDGYHWTLANGGQPAVRPTEPGELMRDPFLQRAPDGSVVMVWTWAWGNPAVLGFSKSTDLIHWSRHRELPVLTAEPNAVNAWAPAVYFEPVERRWLILWSSTIPGRFAGDDTGDDSLNHRIFSTTTTDFIEFSPPAVFFDPGFSVIDATLLQTGPTTTLIFKDERKAPLQKHLLTATGPSLEGPWSNISAPISETWAEGAAIIPIRDGYLALYDHYREPQHYAALFSRDLKVWTDAAVRLSFPPGLRHGSFLQITPAEFSLLNSKPPNHTNPKRGNQAITSAEKGRRTTK